MKPLSLAHLTIADATPSELALAAAGAGFGAVGLRITGFTPEGAGPDLVGRRDRIRNLRGILSDGGLSITSICTYRLVPERAVADYTAVFEACREIGAQTVLITCFINDKERAFDMIAALATLAQDYGLRLGLEFLKTSALRSLDAAEALRRDVGASNIGHIIDALHLCRCGHEPSDLAKLMSGSVYGVQICDASLVAPSRDLAAAEVRNRLYPGEGELPLFDLLECAGPDAWLEIEAPKAEHAGLPIASRADLAFESGRRLMEAYGMREVRRRA